MCSSAFETVNNSSLSFSQYPWKVIYRLLWYPLDSSLTEYIYLSLSVLSLNLYPCKILLNFFIYAIFCVKQLCKINTVKSDCQFLRQRGEIDYASNLSLLEFRSRLILVRKKKKKMYLPLLFPVRFFPLEFKARGVSVWDIARLENLVLWICKQCRWLGANCGVQLQGGK